MNSWTISLRSCTCIQANYPSDSYPQRIPKEPGIFWFSSSTHHTHIHQTPFKIRRLHFQINQDSSGPIQIHPFQNTHHFIISKKKTLGWETESWGNIIIYVPSLFQKNHPPPKKKNTKKHTPNILLLNSYPPHPHNHISWLFTCDRHRFRRVLVIHDSQVARNLGHGPSDSSVSKRRRSSNSWSKARTGDCTRPQREENTHELKKKRGKHKKSYLVWFFYVFSVFWCVFFFEECDIYLLMVAHDVYLSECELKIRILWNESLSRSSWGACQQLWMQVYWQYITTTLRKQTALMLCASLCPTD